MVNQLSGLLDYDRPHLSKLTASERIDYFEKRVRFVVITPLRRIVDNEIHQAAIGSTALLIFGVSLCCAVEATGKFVCGGTNGARVRFDAFVAKYMAADFTTKTIGNQTYGDILWTTFRNGLAHGFTVLNDGFEGSLTDPYFAEKTGAARNRLYINPYRLFDDYVAGFDQYLNHLRADQPNGQLFADFNKMFDLVFIQGK